jgi:hypothetical protein
MKKINSFALAYLFGNASLYLKDSKVAMALIIILILN